MLADQIRHLREGSPSVQAGRLESQLGVPGLDINLSRYGLAEDVKIIMYAPTFRGGSQGTDRTVETGQGFPDYGRLIKALEERFGGEWCVFLRLHPQLVARNLDLDVTGVLISDRAEMHGRSKGQKPGREGRAGQIAGEEKHSEEMPVYRKIVEIPESAVPAPHHPAPGETAAPSDSRAAFPALFHIPHNPWYNH